MTRMKSYLATPGIGTTLENASVINITTGKIQDNDC